MKLSAERLREIAIDGFLEHGDAQKMALELLACRDAQQKKAVGFIQEKGSGTSEFILKAFYGQDVTVGERVYTAPPAPANLQPVAWEMRYWNSGHGRWHDWERITEEKHAELSAAFATDSDHEFRTLYSIPTVVKHG
ncbi:hypothetical protein [Serratia marcescens]|uniref:hypothetical protein n=1 Tax=Serratia TaxID=613 RepID=UPI0014614541|nr:hypothetical protein [Serratia marcescens]MBH3189288.1 hypothetical protein [Serratia marcescens]NMQ37586.1 hypothetical protein [Serratia marcescens]